MIATARRCAPLAALVASLAISSSAQAFVYWPTNKATDGYGVARANLQGGNIDTDFVQTRQKFPNFVAVNGSHVYWTSSDAIGRAKLDGHGIDTEFITGVDNPQGIALDANYVYWANGDSIGRANLDGSSVNQDFITGVVTLTNDFVDGLAVDSGHVYWSMWSYSALGRANLDGSGGDRNFIPNSFAHGIAVNSSNIYWGTWDGLARADLNGTNVNPALVMNLAYGVALSSDHVYWTNVDEDTIGEAKLDGTDAETSFITRATGITPDPWGVAVDPLVAPGKASADNKQEVLGKKVRVAVDIKTHGSGSDAMSLDADLRGKIRVKRGRGQKNPTYDLKRLSVHLRKSSQKLIEMKPSAEDQKKIVKAFNHGYVAVASPTVALTGEDGAYVAKQIRIELKRP